MPNPQDTPSPTGFRESPPFLKNLIPRGWLPAGLACFGLLLLLSARPIGSHDLGNHLRAGEWIAHHRAFPAQDTFTYTQTDRDYLDPHGLFQLTVYFLEESLGYSALTLLAMVLISMTFLALWARLRLSGLSPGFSFLLFLAVVFMSERRFAVRPEIFSWFFLALTLLLLELRNQGKNFLFWIPLIQLLWVNTEGLFALGLLVTAAYALGGRFHQGRWDPKLVRIGLWSLGADLLNPYFLKGVLFPLTLLSRLWHGNLYKQTIVEFFSPWKYLQSQKFGVDQHFQIFIFFFLFLAGAGLLFASFKRWKIHEILLFSAFAALAFAAVRNIPLFALVAVPLLSRPIQGLLEGRKAHWLSGPVAATSTTILVILISLRVATNAFYIGDRRVDRLGWGLDPEQLPVKACEFLRQENLKGRVLNDLGFGGWLNWRGSQPAFIDGRLEVMSDDFYREYTQSAYGTGLDALIGKYHPDLILAEYNASYGWVAQLRQMPSWRLIYLDECTALWAREGYAPEIPALAFSSLLAGRRIPSAPEEKVMAFLSQPLPSKFEKWREGFYRFQEYPLGLSSLGLYSLRAGRYPEARDLFFETLRRSGGGYEETYFNLGVSYLHLQNVLLGRVCLEKALQLNPENPSTRQMLASLAGR